jgi:rhodanese-related sulfurtransferase
MFIEFVNENLWLFLVLAVILNLLVWTTFKNVVNGANTVSPLEMPSLQRKGKSVILDVNKAEHFDVSHIPKSINIQLEDLNSDNKELIKHMGSTVILNCQTGSRSIKASKVLVSLGFSDVHVLRGGLVNWSKENLPLTSKK